MVMSDIEICLKRLQRPEQKNTVIENIIKRNSYLQEKIQEVSLSSKKFRDLNTKTKHRVIWMDEYQRLKELQSNLQEFDYTETVKETATYYQLLGKEEKLTKEIQDIQIIKDSILSIEHWNPWINFNGTTLKFLDLTTNDDLTISRQLDYQEMYDKCHTQVYELNLEYSETLKKDNGGFGLKEFQLFKKLLKEYSNHGRKEFYERVFMEIKGKSKQEFIDLEFWIQKLESYKSKISAHSRKFKNLIKGFIERTIEIYQENQEIIHINKIKQEDLIQREEKSSILHEKVVNWRRQKLAQIRKIEEYLAQELQLKLDQEKQESIKRSREKEKAKNELEKYHQRLLLDVFEQERLLKFRAKEVSLGKKLLSVHNNSRVEYRRALMQDKEREILARRSLEQDQKKWKQKMLEFSKFKVQVKE